MKERYRLFLRRGSMYYAFDTCTRCFESLKTRDKSEARRLLVAMNEACQQPAMNLSLARVYLRHSDPLVATRTWQRVMEEIVKTKHGPTLQRWKTAIKDKALDPVRNLPLIETQAEHLLRVLENGTVSTNLHLRNPTAPRLTDLCPPIMTLSPERTSPATAGTSSASAKFF